DDLAAGQVRKRLRQQRRRAGDLWCGEAGPGEQVGEALVVDVEHAVAILAADPLPAGGDEEIGPAAGAVAEVGNLAVLADRADDDDPAGPQAVEPRREALEFGLAAVA